MKPNQSRCFSPTLTNSPFLFRLNLAEKRLSSNPLNNLDFIMMDLEKPEGKVRHAWQCTTDLTGRTIEFLSRAHRILPQPDDARLHELFHRMMLRGQHFGLSRRYLPYYLYTNDPEAFSVIQAQLDRCVAAYRQAAEAQRDAAMQHFVEFCSCCVEPLAQMYALTGDADYIGAAKAPARVSLPAFHGSHSHGLMTTLRGMLYAAKVSGDSWFLEKVTEYREQILPCQYADGSVGEAFPRSHRTEGCSIADWVMLNLRYAALTGEESALDTAEHSLLNAMFFNQFVTGGFGHRNYSRHGYTSSIEEAWWCCTQTCGLAICEFAEHAVQLTEGGIRINFPVPGVYRLKDACHDLTVTLTSQYPADYSVLARVSGDDAIPVTFRIPGYLKNASVTCCSTPEGRSFRLTGELGHYYEQRPDGWVVKYGPLMLAPMIYGDVEQTSAAAENTIPDGYVRKSVADSGHVTILREAADENGFVPVAAGMDLPCWMVFEDGVGSPLGTNFRAPANIRVRLSDGTETTLCFHPMCYATSNLTLNTFPMVFALSDE